jgi:tetratricopeptide (TPR) repeat protein
LLTHHDPANNKPLVFNFPPVRAFRPDVSPAFEQIIMRALAPRVADRWSSAGEMGRAIRSLPPVTITPVATASGPLLNASRTPSRALLPFEELIVQARGFLDQGRYPDAQKAARKAIESDRTNPQGHKMLGIVYARSRPPDAQRALAAYQESSRLNANDAETERLIGDVYLFLLQKPSDAMSAYQKALRLNPADFETHRFLGMCLEQTNQLEYARQQYAESVRLAPHYVPAHMSYGQLALRLERLVDAERAFVEALRLNPGLPIARHLLAQVYEKQGRMAEALREAEYAVQVDPRDTGAHATLQRLRRAAKSTGRHQTRPR